MSLFLNINTPTRVEEKHFCSSIAVLIGNKPTLKPF